GAVADDDQRPVEIRARYDIDQVLRALVRRKLADVHGVELLGEMFVTRWHARDFADGREVYRVGNDLHPRGRELGRPLAQVGGNTAADGDDRVRPGQAASFRPRLA